MGRRTVLAAIAAVGLAVVQAVPAQSSTWRWPVHGDVVAHFTATDAAPFAAGRHRGIAIAAGSGALVRAACAGRVVFTGSVGRAGPTVSIRCGRLRATYQGLATVATYAGRRLDAGAGLGVLDRAGVLRLGARRERPRSAPERYVDPLPLLSEPPPPLGPAPTCGACRAPTGRGRSGRTRPRAPQIGRPASTPSLRPALPMAAWIGLGLLAFALPPGAFVERRRRRRRSRTEVAVVPRG